MYPEGPERELLKRLAEVERRHKAWVEGMFTNASFPERWGVGKLGNWEIRKLCLAKAARPNVPIS